MIDKGVKLLQLIGKIPGAKKFVKKTLNRIEARSPGYKKLQDKMYDMILKKQKKIAKEKNINLSDVKLSDKDIQRAIANEDRMLKQYEIKKSKIFKKADKLKKGGKINIDGNKFVARQYGGKIGRGSN
tara:strand:+ start:716 stop:1099 length:384 start_codon:yes stop_codon:yes gene_type:complete